MNSGKALVVSVDKRSATDVDVDVNEHAVGEWTFDALHWEVSDGEDVRRVIAELEAYPHKSRTAVKYSLAGRSAWRRRVNSRKAWPRSGVRCAV
nr:Uncharacterised protein [Streptococcus thermophilus]